MEKFKLKGKQKIAVASVAAILSCAVAWKYFFTPLADKLRRLRQDIRQEEDKLRAGFSIEKRKDKISSEYNQYQKYLELKNDLSDAEVVTMFLRDIEKIAQESGLSIITLNPQNQPEASGSARTYTADLRAEGSLKQMLSFFYKVQDNQLLLKLEKLAIIPKDDQATSMRLETTIRIIIP